MMRFPLADIRLDLALQPRASIDEATVQDYAERMRAGDSFPAVVVFYDGTVYWLADGYHRVYAARQLDRTHIDVVIHRGPKESAIWYSFGVNRAHGLKRTNEDKQRAVQGALKHPKAATLSNVAVAKHCGVDEKTVRSVRAAIFGSSEDSAVKEVSRNGTAYTMQTAAIGKPDAAPAVGVYTLPKWSALSPEEQRDIIERGSLFPNAKRLNKQEGEKIEWARWSWNPVTGCYHDCVYCYARDLANLRYPHKFEAALMAERLNIPRYDQPPPEAAHDIGYRNIFTCSMADLFGKWVPQEWIDAVLDTVRASPQWNFLFLTKFPIRLSEQTWPDNAWVGCTVDRQARVSSAERAFRKVKAGVKWLSCEPLLEPLTFSSLEMFDWVVIGPQSRSTQAPAFQPPWEWVDSLLEQAKAAGCKVYFKANLIARPRDYPGDVRRP